MREITVERTGVVDANGEAIYVNYENVTNLAIAAVYNQNPKMTDAGTFAGKVRITIQLLGDMEDGK